MNDLTAVPPYDDLLETIGLIVESGTDQAGWPRALQAVAGLLGATDVDIVEHDFEVNGGRILYSTSADVRFRRQYADTYASRNVLFNVDQNFQVAGRMWHRHELIGDREFFTTDFYAGFLAPRGIHHILTGAVRRDGWRARIVIAGRSASEEIFGTPEHDLLALLAPYLGQSLHVNARLREAGRSLRLSLAALDRMRHGVIIFGLDDRKVKSINRAAQAHLQSVPEISFEDGRLSLAPGPAGQEFEDRLVGLQRGPAGKKSPNSEIALRRKSGDGPLYLVIMPLGDEEDSQGDDQQDILLLLVDPDAARRIEPEQLQRTYDLTPAESRLSALLVAGHTLDRAAGELGITYNTARTHLKQIMAKTDTVRQADVVRVILSGPAALPHDDPMR